MALKRDYRLNPPTKLTELNKDSMLDYVIGLADDKEAAWYIDLLDANIVKKTYNFDTNGGKHKKGEEYEGYDIHKIRREFAKRYFPDIVEKKSKKPTTTHDTKLEELRKKLGK